MLTQGKIWGATRPILQNTTVEVHHIHFKAGCCCSEHLHKVKHNLFYVLSGVLLVRVWQTNDQKGLVDETLLHAGQSTSVPPGLVHQFVGIEGGEALELYWAALSWDDIERRTVGSGA